jgi:hypothetical protein
VQDDLLLHNLLGAAAEGGEEAHDSRGWSDGLVVW